MDKGYNLYNLEASFKKYLLAENISPITLKNYLSDLRHFLGWLTFYWKSNFSNTAFLIDQNLIEILKQVQDDTIEKYKSYLIANNLPLKTINRRLSTLRKFFSFCISQGWLKENPAKKIKNEKIKDKNFFSESEGENEKLDKQQVLKSFQQNLQKENLDQPTIKSYLEVVQEFLSL
jgi:Site-specific recombinase XerD